MQIQLLKTHLDPLRSNQKMRHVSITNNNYTYACMHVN